MRRHLPPLNALRAFEAAARCLSFTRAAVELSVTQAAISHQVKALEERVGQKLFRRAGRGLVLTDAGQTYLAEVGGAFDRIDQATARLVAAGRGGGLKASVQPSFAAKWLIPRLGRFRALYPDIDLLISADGALVDFSRGDFDLAIRSGDGRWPGVRAERIAGERLIVVCSPRLAGLTRPDDLRHHTLLHDQPREAWPLWLAAAGLHGLDPRRGPAFSNATLVIQAAIEGQGVAVVGETLAAPDLAAGRLIRPFDLALAGPYAYWLVRPGVGADRPAVAAFRDWLLAEARDAGCLPRQPPP
jgi:LysR family transcriptional regulator, glycine cleavage system transcriptional activator